MEFLPVPEGLGAPEENLTRASWGEQDALALAYAQTRGAVYGLALSIVRNRQDAEDVTQEVYVRLWQGACRPEGKPMAWLMTVTRNLALDCLRRKEQTQPMPPEDFADAAPTVTVEDRLLLAALLEALNAGERQIVVLHALWGLKHRETAALLGLPLGTVLAKYNRAIKKLREKGVEDA